VSDIKETKIPVTCTPQQAFTAWLNVGERRTFAKAARALNEANHKVSEDTLAKWAKKYRWNWRIDLDALDNQSPAEAAEVLSALGLDIDHKVISGLLGHLIKHANVSMEKIIIKTPGDLKTVVDVMEKLRTVSHNMRGTEISAPPAVKSNDKANGNGEDKVVDLGSFSAADYKK